GFQDDKQKALFIDKFDRDKPDFGAIAPRIASQNPQAVLIFGTGSAVVDGVKALRAAGVTAQIVTLSNNASGGFVSALGSNSHGVVVSQVFPSERAVTYPLVREATDLAQEAKISLTPAMVEGFTSAKVLVEGLRRAGPNPTRARVHDALEGLKKFDVGGLTLSYSADNHSGLDFSDLSIIGSQGQFRR
ncbi:MAG: ABC transporter substrate-binding protein, partial [Giesbergeria sp.]